MKKLIYISLVFAIFYSCKKKEETPEVPVQPAPVNPDAKYYGIFTAEKFCFWTGGIRSGEAHLARVLLFSAPQKEDVLYGGENLGVVQSNSIQLQYNKSLRWYHDTTGTLSYSAHSTFSLSSSSLGSFNYMSPDTFAVVTQSFVDALPDTVDRSKELVISLRDITYFTKAVCTLYDGSVISAGTTKTVSNGATSFTFSPADLNVLKTGNSNFIRILLKRENEKTYNEKLFRFENVTHSDLNVYVK